MSECQGIRCDRCGTRALPIEKLSGTSIPDGWSVVQATRAQPFYKATHDLCPACADGVLSALHRKPT